ncbi:MAG: 50S ribosomal protein L23 [Candidatus Korarchaeota archaeon]|nr:50S ribosomal protein L23 [Candidatus Korarchaeota archaeon]NIU85662.1 50S ribosomal protein L23 [Candidatus Thorarchaeota archaeon]NIW15763.1 50S ribosomal protein L23 [Candidatus Thorarchaeota archaeon]NIW53679.1 50S ribosomal protein L23 [Candidatus Korarchaeota archaeon]
MSLRTSPWKIVKRMHISDKAIRKIKEQNTIVVMVGLEFNKRQVKRAVEELFDVEVEKVNTMITPLAEKKAYVTLRPEYSALDLAIDLGIL